MILVDTSIWIDHLRKADTRLQMLMRTKRVCCHPLIVGELWMGSLAHRSEFMAELRELPQSIFAEHNEVLEFVERRRLFGLGLSFIDAHLLLSTRLTYDTQLWTRDRRLLAEAERLKAAFVG